jgi:hypothetical protein
VTEAAVVLRAAAVLGPLALAGAAIARLGRGTADLFAAVWWGLATISVIAVVLARAGAFSLGAIAAGLVAVAAAAGIAGAIRGRPAAGAATVVPARLRRARRIAVVAGLAACAWSWPPYETFIAASDSTMYVDAGVHLAATGAFAVPDRVGRDLPPDLAQALFRSVGDFDRGPYIRLAGGLLKERREAAMAMPAFFPLLSSLAGVLAAIGGPAWAPVIAPLASGLGTWALTLLAGEMLGAAAAIPTAIFFLGNFAVWWFGRFPMPETLTVAFVWGGLVFLGRGAPLAAGAMLGLGGVARAETLLFAAAALVWWALTSRVSGRELALLVAGAASAGALAAVGLFGAPSHHAAYLGNDLMMWRARMVFTMLPALGDGRILALLVLAPVVPALVALGAAWRGAPVGRTTLRFLAAGATVGLVWLYLRIGGRRDIVRHLGWLAGSMSPLGLALGAAGLAGAWWKGGRVVRLAVLLVALVALVFVPTPRVADYQPWSMRRYLPIVLPGLALFAGAAIAELWRSRRRPWRAVALVLMAVCCAWQVRPILALRPAPYYSGSLDTVARIAERLPADAVVVVDGGFADLQIQVALWLVYGRETIMATGGGPAWRALLAHLVRGARPIYWIQNRYAPAPAAPGIVFTPVATAGEPAIDLPDSPPDAPPAAVMRKLLTLGVYGVGAGVTGTQSGY